jgi:hypothetical protein
VDAFIEFLLEIAEPTPYPVASTISIPAGRVGYHRGVACCGGVADRRRGAVIGSLETVADAVAVAVVMLALLGMGAAVAIQGIHPIVAAPPA